MTLTDEHRRRKPRKWAADIPLFQQQEELPL